MLRQLAHFFRTLDQFSRALFSALSVAAGPYSTMHLDAPWSTQPVMGSNAGTSNATDLYMHSTVGSMQLSGRVTAHVPARMYFIPCWEQTMSKPVIREVWAQVPNQRSVAATRREAR